MAMVILTRGALRDLEELYDYISSHDSSAKADCVIDQIEKTFSSLFRSPNRGSFPKELLALGIREFREIFFKPYRIIYKVLGQKVYVVLVVDGHRDIPALLQRRLLEA